MVVRAIRVLGPERTYVVARTRRVVPGRAFVVAECAPGMAAGAPSGLEMYARSAMLEDVGLREALEAWTAQDDSLARRDDAAIAGAASRRSMARAAHPSARGKRWYVPAPALGPVD